MFTHGLVFEKFLVPFVYRFIPWVVITGSPTLFRTTVFVQKRTDDSRRITNIDRVLFVTVVEFTDESDRRTLLSSRSFAGSPFLSS